MKTKEILSIILFISLSLPAFSQTKSWDEAQKIVPSERLTLNFFANALAVSGDYAVIGEYQSQPVGVRMEYGAAYIYRRQGPGLWSPVTKLQAPQNEDYDHFGRAVAIDDTTIAIGCVGDRQDVNEANDLLRAGSVYIFTKNSLNQWKLRQKIVASDRTAEAYFGYTVSISGSYLIVGAPFDGLDSIGGSNVQSEAGSAYIFERDSKGMWQQLQKLVPKGREANDNFGGSVIISDKFAIVGSPDDGSTALGDPANTSGAVVVFKKQSNGKWTQVQELFASDAENGADFGWSVAMSKGFLIVGAPGQRLDLSGQNPLSDAGAAYLFKLDQNDQWQFNQKIISPEREKDNWFGESVAIEDENVVVGAPDWGKEYSEDSAWLRAGASYVFKYTSSWHYFQTLRAADIDELERFGGAIAIDNEEIMIGAQSDHIVGRDYKFAHAGAAYAFKLCSPTKANVSWSGGSLKSELRGAYQWLDCDKGYKPIDNAVQQFYRPFKTGTYAVRVAHGGCVDTSDCVTFNLGIETIGRERIKLFPNPSTGTFQLESADLNIDRIIVCDAMGRIVYDLGPQKIYDISEAASGLYFVKVFTEEGIAIKRLELE